PKSVPKFSPPRTNGSTDRMPHAKTPLEVDFARHTFFGILKYELDGRDPQRDRRRQSRVPTRRHASEALAYCATHRGKGSGARWRTTPEACRGPFLGNAAQRAKRNLTGTLCDCRRSPCGDRAGLR